MLLGLRRRLECAAVFIAALACFAGILLPGIGCVSVPLGIVLLIACGIMVARLGQHPAPAPAPTPPVQRASREVAGMPVGFWLVAAILLAGVVVYWWPQIRAALGR